MSEFSTKTDKLASALYLVTSFFDDKEPLKWKLRALSTDLVSTSIRDKSIIAREIISIFSLVKNAGLISEANYNILIQELSKLEDETKKSLDFIFINGGNGEVKKITEPLKSESIKDKIEESLKDNRPALKEFGIVSVKKNSRQSIIINILKRKKEIMIKDVTPLISGCSEKTIQRELSSMVEQGLLKKFGEKRWSRYSLA